MAVVEQEEVGAVREEEAAVRLCSRGGDEGHQEGGARTHIAKTMGRQRAGVPVPLLMQWVLILFSCR
eukprot:2792662-Heterocapsa_arctica.AAC.1